MEDDDEMRGIKEFKMASIFEVETKTLPGGIRYKTLITAEMSDKAELGVGFIDPGASAKSGIITWDHLAYVIKGNKLMVTHNGKKTKAREGYAFIVPSGTEFDVENLSAEPAMVVYVACPPIPADWEKQYVKISKQ